MAMAAGSSSNSKKEWKVQSYVEQQDRVWPREGRHILAQYDDNSVVVYQAYCTETAEYAVANQRFGGDRFSFTRMSWVKPNFLWMMYRCGWASKPNQEKVLAVRITREGFDQILSKALTGQDEKAAALPQRSEVRLQWDPDHTPTGESTQRRAIQLGLRDQVLQKYATDWIVEIRDITDFVKEQHQYVLSNQTDQLLVAEERVYPVADLDTATQIHVDTLSN